MRSYRERTDADLSISVPGNGAFMSGTVVIGQNQTTDNWTTSKNSLF